MKKNRLIYCLFQKFYLKRYLFPLKGITQQQENTIPAKGINEAGNPIREYVVLVGFTETM